MKFKLVENDNSYEKLKSYNYASYSVHELKELEKILDDGYIRYGNIFESNIMADVSLSFDISILSHVLRNQGKWKYGLIFDIKNLYDKIDDFKNEVVEDVSYYSIISNPNFIALADQKDEAEFLSNLKTLLGNNFDEKEIEKAKIKDIKEFLKDKNIARDDTSTNNYLARIKNLIFYDKNKIDSIIQKLAGAEQNNRLNLITSLEDKLIDKLQVFSDYDEKFLKDFANEVLDNNQTIYIINDRLKQLLNIYPNNEKLKDAQNAFNAYLAFKNRFNNNHDLSVLELVKNYNGRCELHIRNFSPITITNEQYNTIKKAILTIKDRAKYKHFYRNDSDENDKTIFETHPKFYNQSVNELAEYLDFAYSDLFNILNKFKDDIVKDSKYLLINQNKEQTKEHINSLIVNIFGGLDKAETIIKQFNLSNSYNSLVDNLVEDLFKTKLEPMQLEKIKNIFADYDKDDALQKLILKFIISQFIATSKLKYPTLDTLTTIRAQQKEDKWSKKAYSELFISSDASKGIISLYDIDNINTNSIIKQLIGNDDFKENELRLFAKKLNKNLAIFNSNNQGDSPVDVEFIRRTFDKLDKNKLKKDEIKNNFLNNLTLPFVGNDKYISLKYILIPIKDYLEMRNINLYKFTDSDDIMDNLKTCYDIDSNKFKNILMKHFDDLSKATKKAFNEFNINSWEDIEKYFETDEKSDIKKLKEVELNILNDFHLKGKFLNNDFTQFRNTPEKFRKLLDYSRNNKIKFVAYNDMAKENRLDYENALLQTLSDSSNPNKKIIDYYGDKIVLEKLEEQEQQ